MKAEMSSFFFIVLCLLTFCASTWAISFIEPEKWSEPVPLIEVNTNYHDKAPFLSFDGLTLYFSRQDGPGWYYTRIYQATRLEPRGPFTSIEEISNLNYSSGHVDYPWVSPDNLRMYYYRVEGSVHRLKVTERLSIDEPWQPGIDITELNALGGVANPSLTEDELIIFFTGTDVPSGLGGYDIWMATREDRNSPFDNVINLTEINSPAWDFHPSISPDGITLYFTSRRNGDSQLFRTKRQSLDADFCSPEQVSILDSQGIGLEYPFLSADGSAFYFTKSIDAGQFDIWVRYFSDLIETNKFYVDAINGSDLNNGLSPETAFATIQKAIDSTEQGDTIIVYSGNYYENINLKGKNITLKSTDPNNPDIVAATIIDGSQNGSVVTFNSGESPDCVLTGFTITNGQGDKGGGIFASNASPTVTNCVLTDNTANAGGAVYCSDSNNLRMENCTIDRNYSGFGGAMYCLLSSTKLTDCTFSTNQGTWAGGAIYSDKSTPILNNCVFNDNSTNGDGGGMFNEASGPKLSNCAFSYNSARTGGGIYCEPGCEPIIIGGKIAQNYADYGGGIYVTECINVKVTNCFIIRNMAILGAGIYSIDSVLTIKQSVFRENMAYYGGAVFCDAQPDGKLVMNNCTLANNSAIVGRSIACDSFFGSSTVTVTNSILYNGAEEIWNNDNSTIAITYSDVYGGWPGKNNIDADPLFTDIVRGVYHLLPDSPCIDAGDPQYLPQPDETDINGNPRLVGKAIDMGAYEAQPSIELTVNWFEFDATIGFPNPDDQILIIRNSGAGTLNWQISYDCYWLKVEPNSGSSQVQGNTAWLKVDTTGLTEGQYHCQLTVSAPLAINSPQTVYVTLFVHKNCFSDTPEYAKQYADFLEYAAYGADPSCWCASTFDGTHYQCDGDTSGKKQKFTEYRIFTDDLALIIKNWRKKIDTADPCADIDHKAQPLFKYRVYTNDLAILIKNWKKRDNQLPNDCPRPDGQ